MDDSHVEPSNLLGAVSLEPEDREAAAIDPCLGDQTVDTTTAPRSSAPDPTGSQPTSDDASLPATPLQDSPTSPVSPPPELGDPEDAGGDDGAFFSSPRLPPTPNLTPQTSSPLSPTGSRRALQPVSPRVPPPTPPSPTGNKHAHQSKPQHYSKLRSKLRKDRERELLSQKGSMGKSKLEDKLIRDRMVHSLRKNLKIPNQIRAAIRALIERAAQKGDVWRAKIGRYSFMDFCEMWRFQYLEPAELIQIKGWEGTVLEDPDIIRYVISYCRQEVGLPQGGTG
ncbi:hypothetical protein DRE_00493 [Drechslerella stenobrocha 248]|uniref:Uncharacterized protein n=1 Tax=Drechslerella stenobrocha 248 TaxID=1043628 RepID=W7IEU6_9PEZI|nr:hypothetical protein DRE_00493 [Drechslerella stenobrocha 248]